MTEVSGLLNRAVDLHRQGHPELALSEAQRAVLFAPVDPLALNIRGMIFQAMDRKEEARQDFDLAIAFKPDFADAINNRGTLLARYGQFEQALICYERSLAIDPQQPHARYNCATTRLVLGDWIRGFREFETRWELFPHEVARRRNLSTVWLGQCSVAGKTLLLHHEQGYGDVLQFCRYVVPVMERGARVILAAPSALKSLLRTLPGQPRVVAEGEPVPPHDYCCSLMSLPMVFGTTPDTVPSPVPYLRAAAAKVRAWRERLGTWRRPRVGLVWSGRRYPPINQPRDIALTSILPLLELDTDVIALQQNVTPAERMLLSEMANVSLLGDELKDFEDTAALIETLDLVITVDTAVAHLAGAMGKPVWVMNRFASCWRWLLHRTDSPWYPTLRLFRQPRLGDWETVVREVARCARRFIHELAQHRIHLDRRSASGGIEDPDTDFTIALNAALNQHRNGQLAHAAAAYRQILQFHDEQPQALHFLGVALAQQAQCEEAASVLARAAAAVPVDPLVHIHYGNALAGLERYEEALSAYDRALALDGDSAEAHYNRGIALGRLGRENEAIASYERAIRCNTHHVQAHNNLGNILTERGNLEAALRCYERAVQLRPEYVEAWINCANTQRRLHCYDDALASSEHALRLASEFAEAYSSRGATLVCLGRTEEALRCYERAIELKPDLAEGLWNKAIAHLSRGEFREGWNLYEARWNVRSLRLSPFHTPRPLWCGREPLQDKTILLHAEQGYGDTIQFSRYAPLVAARGARVILGVPSALKALMRSIPDVAAVVSRGDPPPFDYHCPLLSLPLAFGTDLDTIPAAPYLTVDAAARERWAVRLGSGSSKRIGLAWSGSPTHANDANRSIALEQLLVLTHCDARFVSLQKETRSADLASLESAEGILRLGGELADFADAAALVSELDLVITVDTAVAHLAGAIGKPVWILLPHVADWRWLQGREDSPWYPSARLFRQTAPGNWAQVIERVAALLAATL